MRKILSVLFVLFFGSMLFGMELHEKERILPFQELEFHSNMNSICVSNIVNVDDVADTFYLLSRLPVTSKSHSMNPIQIYSVEMHESNAFDVIKSIVCFGLTILTQDPEFIYPKEGRKITAEGRLEELGF